MVGDDHASAQLPSTHPDKRTVRWRDVRAVDVIDERIGSELPSITAGLDRLTPPEHFKSDTAPAD
jgi:hypothetical protein